MVRPDMTRRSRQLRKTAPLELQANSSSDNLPSASMSSERELDATTKSPKGQRSAKAISELSSSGSVTEPRVKCATTESRQRHNHVSASSERSDSNNSPKINYKCLLLVIPNQDDKLVLANSEFKKLCPSSVRCQYHQSGPRINFTAITER